MGTERTVTATTRIRDLPKGPNGRALCRFCQTEVPVGKHSFCSEDCVHEWRIRSDSGYARWQVEKRDKGVCSMCGLDTKKLQEDNKEAYKAISMYDGGAHYELLVKASGKDNWPKGWSFYQTLWQMDHILPVVEGGGACGLDNLRTLCIPCHKQVTNELRKRLSVSKKREVSHG